MLGCFGPDRMWVNLITIVDLPHNNFVFPLKLSFVWVHHVPEKSSVGCFLFIICSFDFVRNFFLTQTYSPGALHTLKLKWSGLLNSFEQVVLACARRYVRFSGVFGWHLASDKGCFSSLHPQLGLNNNLRFISINRYLISSLRFRLNWLFWLLACGLRCARVRPTGVDSVRAWHQDLCLIHRVSAELKWLILVR